uniref:Uncharacterized protein n=1 Tax=Anguilla anguilla TaxID=7936 RepID=A0A0E9U6Q7_ANGAN
MFCVRGGMVVLFGRGGLSSFCTKITSHNFALLTARTPFT